MSLLDKFKDQFVDRDDEDMEEEDLGEETAPVNPAAPVPPRPAAARGISRSAIPRQAAKPYTMVVVSPKSYSDAEKIGDHLKAMRPVVMNMEKRMRMKPSVSWISFRASCMLWMAASTRSLKVFISARRII